MSNLSRQPRPTSLGSKHVIRLPILTTVGGRRREPELDVPRPKTRADCINGVRPCAFVGCRHHNYLEILPPDTRGRVGIRFAIRGEPDELPESCSLDRADKGPASLDEIAAIHNVTRERARQLEQQGLRALGRRIRRMGDEF